MAHPTTGPGWTPTEPNRRGWHVKKEISLGDMLAFISAGLAILYAYTTLDKRVTVLETTATVQKVTDDRQDGDALRYQARIDKSLEEINRKLDRMLELRR